MAQPQQSSPASAGIPLRNFGRADMLATGFPFDSAQMPLNAFDTNFQSFETQVLPELQKRGIAVLGMKPLQGTGAAISHQHHYPTVDELPA